ncbi:MAG: HTH domain-containing protein, partial [Firmicutes bacterium]|nr:HTH domain-containing protein [Bacillota bacterium]
MLIMVGTMKKKIRIKLISMNEREKNIYEIIKDNNTVTTEEISIMLDTTARTVVRYIRSLREKG